MPIVDDIKARVDIVNLVSQYVPLQKSGASYKARCPFHTEKTPSFFVFPARQSWRCFGACATGGDAFSFIMRVENVDFGEALKRLAQQTGIPLPARGQSARSEGLYAINEAAAQFYARLLASPEGAQTRNYLASRGLTPKSFEEFQLGLSPQGEERFRPHLLSLGYKEEQLAQSGLLSQNDDGRYRDLFRGRLMFPIRDAQGRTVGFGARALDHSNPKYLNSRQSPVFDKGRLLYGLYRAQESIRQGGAVVVEGYMDVIVAHQNGFSNVVASMGTSLTRSQVDLLHGLTSDITMALDPDAAGQEATLRSLESSWQVFQQRVVSRSRGATLYERGNQSTLKIAPLPAGKDPDEIILADPKEWERVVARATPLMEFLFTALSSKLDLATPQGKAQMAEMLFPLIAATPNPFEQDHHFQRLAALLGVSPERLEANFGRPRTPSRVGVPRAAPASTFGRLDRDPLEEHCLALLLQQPQLGALASNLRLDHFKRVENRGVFTYWNQDFPIEDLDEELKAHLDYLSSKPLPAADTKQQESVLLDCLRRLEQRRLRNLKVEEGLRFAEENPEEVAHHQEEILLLNEQLNSLFGPPRSV